MKIYIQPYNWTKIYEMNNIKYMLKLCKNMQGIFTFNEKIGRIQIKQWKTVK